MAANVVSKCGIAIGGDTCATEVIDIGHFVGSVADTLGGSSFEVGNGCDSVDFDTTAFEVGAADIVGAHLFARFVCLGVEFESL